MYLIEILEWVKIHRMLIIISMENGAKYEIDGRMFRVGVYSRYANREKAGRKKMKESRVINWVEKEEIQNIWMYLPGRSIVQNPTAEILEGAMKKFPKKTPKNEVRKYIVLRIVKSEEAKNEK